MGAESWVGTMRMKLDGTGEDPWRAVGTYWRARRKREQESGSVQAPMLVSFDDRVTTRWNSFEIKVRILSQWTWKEAGSEAECGQSSSQMAGTVFRVP